MRQPSRLQPVVSLLCLVSLFFGLFLLTVPARAAEAEGAAKVVALRGAVIAVDARGIERPLGPGDPVMVTDTVKTGPQGRLQLLFSDNTIISLGSDAEMEISRYQWDSKQGELTTRVNRGAFRVMGGAITRTSPENFTTETPSATIGIRGSMYAGRVSNGTVTVVFLGGTGITVTNPGGMVEISIPGMGTRVMARDQPPETPTRFSEEELSEMENGEMTEGAEEEQTAQEQEQWDDMVAEEQESPPPPTVEETRELVTELSTVSGQDELVEELQEGDGWSGWALTGWDYSLGEESGSGVELVALKPGLESDEWSPEGEEPLVAGTYQGAYWEEDWEEYWEEYDGGYSYMQHGHEGMGEFFAGAGYGEEWSEGPEWYGWERWLTFYFYGRETTAALMPGSGGDRYEGHFLAVDRDPALLDPGFGDFSFVVNWRTGAVVGYFIDSEYGADGVPVYFSGRVSGDDLVDVRIMGIDHNGNGEPAGYGLISGGSTFASFYGSVYQGFGMTGEGGGISLADYSATDDGWLAIAAAFRSLDFAYADRTDSSIWQGFVTGAAVNLTTTTPASPIMLMASTDLELEINRAQGTFSGTIGGELTTAGVYVSDQAMLGEISADSLYQENLEMKLNDQGNLLMANPNPDLALAEHLAWGYWAINFDDAPLDGERYQLDPGGSFWVAGETTPQAYVEEMIDDEQQANYRGGAQGVQVSGSEISALTGGATDLTVFFGSDPTINGTISFDQVSLSVAGDVTATGFNAEITNMATGSVNGAFFGPNAEAIGGNFHAGDYNDTHYIGIFGGTRGDGQQSSQPQ